MTKKIVLEKLITWLTMEGKMEDTLSTMDHYNFEAPIKVAISFDESDAESDVESGTESLDEVHIKLEEDGLLEEDPIITTENHDIPDLAKSTEVAEITLIDKEIKSNKHKRKAQNITADEEMAKCNKNDKYISDLLRTVSEYIIMILRDYQRHVANAQSKRLSKSESEIRFFKLKHHFFSLSYNTVVTIIVPEEKNEVFINRFIKNTVQLWNTDSQTKYTSDHIMPIFKELLLFVKDKRDLLSVFKKANKSVYSLNKETIVYPTDHSTLRAQLENRIPNGIENSNNNTNSLVLNKLNIFSYGPPGRQIRLDVDLNALPEKRKEYSKTSRVENQIVNNNIRHNNACLPNQPVSSKMDQITAIIPNSNYEVPISYKRLNNIQYRGQTGNVLPPSYESSTRNHIQQNAVLEFNSQQPLNNYQYQNHNMHHFQNALRSIRPLQTRHTIQNQNNMQNIPSGFLSQQVTNLDKKTTRSLSTDSGINSPLSFIHTAESLNPTTNEQDSPYITHYSLNPNAILPMTGLCTVCRKVTKHMCIGCYKSYYCSQECQKLNWNAHRQVCDQQMNRYLQ